MSEQQSEQERFEAWADSRKGASLRHSLDGGFDYPLGRLLREAFEAGAALSKPSTEWTHEVNQELERQYLKGFQAGKAFEREQCALVCENYRATWSVGGDEFAAAIRSRKDAP